jgi:hypothetical protein
MGGTTSGFPRGDRSAIRRAAYKSGPSSPGPDQPALSFDRIFMGSSPRLARIPRKPAFEVRPDLHWLSSCLCTSYSNDGAGSPRAVIGCQVLLKGRRNRRSVNHTADCAEDERMRTLIPDSTPILPDSACQQFAPAIFRLELQHTLDFVANGLPVSRLATRRHVARRLFAGRVQGGETHEDPNTHQGRRRVSQL